MMVFLFRFFLISSLFCRGQLGGGCFPIQFKFCKEGGHGI